MDPQRFEAFSRALATGPSRRGVLKGIVGAILGGSLVGARSATAGQSCAGPGESCSSGADCCSGECSDAGVCYCTDPSRPWVGCECQQGDASACNGDADLCCDDGTCASPMTGCKSTCTEAGDTCSSDADCCSGKCSDEGMCYCTDPARPWIGCDCSQGDDDACDGHPELCCSDGTCASPSTGCDPTCAHAGDTCSSDDDCCEGSCSDSGVCYCADPARPWIGCSCNQSDPNACDGNQGLCCNDGTCASPSTGCQ